jgi:hypothetical protein
MAVDTAVDLPATPPVMAERLEAIQPGVLPEFQALGLAFTAGLEEDRAT